MYRIYPLILACMIALVSCDKVGDDAVPPSPTSLFSEAYDVGFGIESYDAPSGIGESVFGSLHDSKVLSLDDVEGRAYHVSMGYVRSGDTITLQSLYQISTKYYFPTAWTQFDQNLCQINFRRLRDFDNSPYDFSSIRDEFSYNRFLFKLDQSVPMINETTFDAQELQDGYIYYAVDIKWDGAGPDGPSNLKGVLRVREVIDNPYIHKIVVDAKMMHFIGQ